MAREKAQAEMLAGGSQQRMETLQMAIAQAMGIQQQQFRDRRRTAGRPRGVNPARFAPSGDIGRSVASATKRHERKTHEHDEIVNSLHPHPHRSRQQGTADAVITDKQLFDHAVAPDPVQAEASAPERPQQQPQQQPTQPGEQPRDPQGKFAPKPQPKPQQRQPEDIGYRWRELLRERDARQRLEAHAAELTRAVMAVQQRMNPQQPQQPQGPETIFDDPERT